MTPVTAEARVAAPATAAAPAPARATPRATTTLPNPVPADQPRSQPRPRLRVVLGDDHRLFLDALGRVLEELGHHVVGLASTPEAAVSTVKREHPDCCLLDVSFPDGSGIDVIPLIRAASPGTAVLVLSAVDDPRVAEAAMERGAMGFLRKTGSLPAMAEALEAVGRGETVGVAAPARPQGAIGRPTGPLWKVRFLTDREWQVMGCIMEGRSTDQIASALGVRRSTARTHVQNLLAKLGVHTRLQAAALMTAQGSAELWPLHLRPGALGHLAYRPSVT